MGLVNRQKERSGQFPGAGLSLLLLLGLMNGTDQEITHAANEDHGRNSPQQQYWHDTLLCFCPRLENAEGLPVVPDRFWVLAGAREI
jgi:hypothetical protein